MRAQRLKLACGAAACTLLISAPCYAETAEKGVKKDELSATLQEIDAAKSRNVKREMDLARIKREYGSIQRMSVSLADDIQANESQLTQKERALVGLEKQSIEKNAAFETNRKHFAELVSSMVKLKQVPQGMLLAKPEDLPNMMRTAKVLDVTSKTMESQAKTLTTQLAEITSIKQQISDVRAEVVRRNTKLLEQQQTLEQQLDNRAQLQKKLDQDREAEQARIRELSRRSQSLQDLIAELEKDKKTKIAKQKASPATKETPAPKREEKEIALAKGALRQPVAGQLLHTFGERKNENETYKGHTLRTSKNAQVVSPEKGEVVFTGPFMDYGRIVIIRHNGNYHTLLAGLAVIRVEAGQKLLKGEPVGSMGGERGNGNELYVELRRDSKPIDPSPWIGNLATLLAKNKE